ncbi:carboxypeptidase regulatory-like domain-containing protein, partial [Candidatus Hydrogenedentota bacterium]
PGLRRNDRICRSALVLLLMTALLALTNAHADAWTWSRPALSKKKHKGDLARKVVAAVPFGNAAWLSQIQSSATSKVGLVGGIDIMAKKILIAVGAIIVVMGLFFVANPRQGDVAEKNDELTVSRGLEEPGSSHRVEENRPEQPSQREARRETADMPGPVTRETAKLASEEQVVAEKLEKISGVLLISGQVTDLSTGSPLAGAEVNVKRTGRGAPRRVISQAVTAEDGRYELLLLAPKKGCVVSASTHGTSRWPASSARCTPEKDCSAEKLEWDFALSVGAAISGRVVERKTGNGIAGAVVVARKNRSTPLTSASEEDGRFEFSGLETGPS